MVWLADIGGSVRGHLEQRGKNTWRAKVYLGRDDATGRKRYLTRTIRGTKRQADEVLTQMLVEGGLGSQVVTRATLKDLSARWLLLAQPTLSPTTYAEYERLLTRLILPALGAVKLRSLRTAQIDNFYSEIHARGGRDARPLSAMSVHHVHALLRRILNQGVRWGWLSTNPAVYATPPRPRRREITPPDPADVLRLLVEADRRDPDLGVLLRLAAVTGARRGELCGLRVSDVDLLTGTLTIARSVAGRRRDELAVKDTKTRSGRRIALDQETVRRLAVHLDHCEARAIAIGTPLPPTAFLFADLPDGSTPSRPSRVTERFIRLRDQLGLRHVRLHDLRHAAATQMLAAGVPVRTVAGRLGHAQPSTTLNVYAAWLTQGDQEAARTMGEIFARR
jgi:integrase